MSGLLDWQRSFIDAMHRPQATPPQLGHKAGLDVYRNNIRSSLIEALKEAFPHTLTLLGEGCFSAEAASFVATSPPQDPRLSRYGQGFADALARAPALAPYRFVADIARLEHARLQVSHAAEAVPLEASDIGAVLDDQRLVQARPASRTIRCQHDVEALWQALERGEGGAPLGERGAGHWLVIRSGRQVRLRPLDAASAALYGLLDTPTSLSQALGELADSGVAEDALGHALGTLVGHGALAVPDPAPTLLRGTP
ncbi:DNA-binding domain-containing protein [Halomonas sp.]|uniref:HvfC/BufC N-terminal domain-containing protein n=1 Tax=Halomonas sp. TaxID=1486246 RepID=UPI000C8B40BD|nr:DNA-binding domain-containing protein [Halomonas sp.]MAR72841.1 hypothetical protein [Halomonas sp.]